MSRLKEDSLRNASGAAGGAGSVNYRAYSAWLKALEAERVGNLDTAEQLLKSAMDYDPGSATLQAALGKVLAEKRQIPQSIAVTRKALELQPDHVRANLQLAGLLQFNNQPEDSEKVYLKLIKTAPDHPDAYLELANLYRAQGRGKEGLELLELFQSRGGEASVRMQLLKAALYKDMKQGSAAEAELLDVLDIYSDSPYAQKALLELYLAEGDLKVTAVRLEALYKVKPWQAWIVESLVEIYARLADVPAINRRLAAAAEDDLEYAERLRLEAVEELATRREFDKAMEVLKPVLARSTDNNRALLYAGFLHARRKEYAKAIELYGRIPQSSEFYDRALEQRALSLQATGETDKAIGLLRSYLEGEPDAEDARYTLITIFGQADRHEEALSEVDQLLKRNPSDLEAIIQKAYVLQDMGRSEEALQILRAELTGPKSNPRVYDSLSRILADNDRFQEAADTLKEALKLYPDNIELRFYLGSYYDRLKMHDEAVAQMQKILELDENHADALNFIGYTWAEQKVRLPEAELLLKRALELEPNSGYITDSLGWVYYQIGRYEEAVGLLERAVALTSQEPVIVEHLGDAYVKLGKRDKAIEAYQRAAQEFKGQERPLPEDGERIAKKLEELKAEPVKRGEPGRKGGNR